MEQVFEALVVAVITLIFLWYHVTHFFTGKIRSAIGLAFIIAGLIKAYDTFYKKNYPVYVYTVVPLIFLLIDIVIVRLRSLW